MNSNMISFLAIYSQQEMHGQVFLETLQTNFRPLIPNLVSFLPHTTLKKVQYNQNWRFYGPVIPQKLAMQQNFGPMNRN